MPDIVQQRRHSDRETLHRRSRAQLANLLQACQRTPGQMIRAERMFEAGMSGAGIDQKTVADLSYVPEALNGGSVESEQRRAVDTDVIPERVADGFSGTAGQRVRTDPAPMPTRRLHTIGPAAATAGGTSAR